MVHYALFVLGSEAEIYTLRDGESVCALGFKAEELAF